MEHIKGPDFPTKGIIMGRSGIRAAYATGGPHRSPRPTEMEGIRQPGPHYRHELPYQVNVPAGGEHRRPGG